MERRLTMSRKIIKDNLIFENVNITFKNFSGVERPPYNAKGQRNFAVVIEDEDFARELKKEGWNVKWSDPKEDGTTYAPHLQVKVAFDDEEPWKNPRIMMEQAGNKVYLDENTVSQLDDLEVVNVKAMEIRPYNYDTGKMQGVTAYLKKMRVEVARDMFCD